MRYDALFEALGKTIDVRSVVVGMGNTLRSDDGIGVRIAEALTGRVPCRVFSAGVTPENFLGKIAHEHPKNVFFVDAVDFGATPAEAHVFDRSALESQDFFLTHNASISLLFDAVRARTSAACFLIAVQPKRVAFGEHLTRELDEFLDLFCRRFPLLFNKEGARSL